MGGGERGEGGREGWGKGGRDEGGSDGGVWTEIGERERM